MIRLLLVEDEQNIGATLADLLEGSGYEVNWVQSRSEAAEAIREAAYDVALLDVNLPDGTGFEVARSLRPTTTAMLFLTAMGDPDYRVQGLQLGAEDYILKPFHFAELQLRIRNALKRRDYLRATSGSTTVCIGAAQVDFTGFTASREGKTQDLSAKEARLLQLLWDRRGKVVSRDEILVHVWPSEAYPTARTVDNFILSLRKLVEPKPESPQIIKTVRGAGYQLIEAA